MFRYLPVNVLVHGRVDAVYTAFGLLMATSVLGFLWVPRLKEFLSLGHEHVVDWYLHQYPKVFMEKKGGSPRAICLRSYCFDSEPQQVG
jgi:hypothetical protein